MATIDARRPPAFNTMRSPTISGDSLYPHVGVLPPNPHAASLTAQRPIHGSAANAAQHQHAALLEVEVRVGGKLLVQRAAFHVQPREKRRGPANVLGGWGSPLTVFPPEVRAAYVRALRDPGHAHAICEEYRAAATLDRDCEPLQAMPRMSGVPVRIQPLKLNY